MFLGIAVNILFLNFFQGLIGARFAVICLSIEKAVWCFFLAMFYVCLVSKKIVFSLKKTSFSGRK